ncbi:glycosyl transferase [Halobacillus sp. BBL2006]|nr:glycosyl transferase [Halobacillus sp. BBL2006]
MDQERAIPKIIHYCWFGGKEKPKIVKHCLKSWDKYLSDYELKEWNEQNFDIYSNKYVKEAYDAGKFAFVSDYVRLFVLFYEGGIYLDTDVEVFKPFDDLLFNESFWGFEQENYIATSTIGARKHHSFIKRFLDTYEEKNFINESGAFNLVTNVAAVTDLLKGKGLILNGEYQYIEGVGGFYPQTYFSPFDYINYRRLNDETTYAMHYFHKSWMPVNVKIKTGIKRTLSSVIGGSNIYKLRRLMNK